MRSKPPVSTKALNNHLKKEKIKNVLKNHPEGLSPKQIALYSRINVNTVKSIIPKMKEISLKKGLRGYYILVENNTHRLFDYKLQNLCFCFESKDIKIKERIYEENNLKDIIKFRFEIGAGTKKAHLYIDTSYPFNFSCLGLLGYLFQNLIEKHCSIRPDISQITIKTLELNKDYFGVMLEGCSSIKLDTLLLEYKLYYKNKSYVREEYKSKVPIQLDFLYNLLNKGIFSAEISQKISFLENQMQEINKILLILRRTLSKFILKTDKT